MAYGAVLLWLEPFPSTVNGTLQLYTYNVTVNNEFPLIVMWYPSNHVLIDYVITICMTSFKMLHKTTLCPGHMCQMVYDTQIVCLCVFPIS